jgi:hypothetical protein
MGSIRASGTRAILIARRSGGRRNPHCRRVGWHTVGGGWGVYQGIQGLFELARKKRQLAIVTAPNGQRLTIRGEHADKTRIILGDSRAGGWSLDLHHGKDQRILLEGDHARRATALIMPKINVGGASRARVQTAVNRIETSGDAERFLNQVARTPPQRVKPKGWRAEKRKKYDAGISKLPLETRPPSRWR